MCYSFIAAFKSKEEETLENDYWIEAFPDMDQLSQNTQMLPISSINTPEMNLNLFVELM